MYTNTNAREEINVIKQKYELRLIYRETVIGPPHAQVWLGVWLLYGTGEIGRATASTKIAAKEDSARLAVVWLIGSGY